MRPDGRVVRAKGRKQNCVVKETSRPWGRGRSMGDHNQYLGMQQLGKRLGKEPQKWGKRGPESNTKGVPT